MPGDKYELDNMKIVSVAKLLTYIYNSMDINIQANNELSDDLEKFIGKFERGENVEHEKFMQIINRSMECTKWDPHADEGEDDALEEVGQVIFNTLKFPRPHAGLMMTLFKEFGGTLAGSQRDSFHFIAMHLLKLTEKITGTYEIIEPTTIVPLSRGEKKKKEKEAGFSKKVKFR